MSTRIPVIHLSIEGLRDRIAMMLEDWGEKHRDAINVAVQKAADEGEIQRTLNRIVEETLRQVLQEEVENFFKFGPGRKSLNAACRAKLTRMFDGDKP